jgi:hypothetical protein
LSGEINVRANVLGVKIAKEILVPRSEDRVVSGKETP